MDFKDLTKQIDTVMAIGVGAIVTLATLVVVALPQNSTH